MRWLIALLLCASCLALPAPALAKKPVVVRHTVKRGDTLSGIAAKYNTSVGSICRWNALKKTAMLTPGRKLGVPLPPGSSSASESDVKEPAHQGKTWRDFVKQSPHPGAVSLKSYTSEWQGQVLDAQGKVTDGARAAFEQLLSSKRSDDSKLIDERLIKLVAKVSDTFGGRTLYVVSGYRPSSRSRHGHGQAVDFRVDGVPNWALRDFVLSFEKVGVGYYPNSTFVHLDVREHSSFWIDVSKPGQRARYVKPKRASAKKKQRAKRSRR